MGWGYYHGSPMTMSLFFNLVGNTTWIPGSFDRCLRKSASSLTAIARMETKDFRSFVVD
jgi:hypothetical protein